ncbi:hypothetical protein SDC9_86927 [bioreactor metagenome]|uniref:Porin domain-containing protein n=1 Tax=bioreactor metagenome TaxID=1076179 RepID=A0A644ZHT7_9ZZZZ
MKKHKSLRKRYLAATLALAISLSFAGTSYAAPAQKDIDALKKEIAELNMILKVEQRKSQAMEKAKEKKAAWNFDGDARIKYAELGSDSKMLERVRIGVNHDLGKDVRFHATWNVMNDNEFGLTNRRADNLYRDTASYYYGDFDGADNNWLSKAYVEMDKSLLGSNTTTIGRFGQTFGATGFWSDEETNGGIDGIKLTFDDKRITVGFANFGATQDYPTYVAGGTGATYPGGSTAVPYYLSKGLEDAFFINAKMPVSKATTFHGMYLREVGSKTANALKVANTDSKAEEPRLSKHDLHGIGISTKINEKVTFLGDYLQNIAVDGDQDAIYLSLRYKGADIAKPGSFGLNFDYRKVDAPYYTAITANGKQVQGSYSILCGNLLSSDRTLVEDNRKGPVFGFQWAAGHDLLVEGKQSFSTKNTETGASEDDYTSISLSTRF